MTEHNLDDLAAAVAARVIEALPRGRLPITPEYLSADQVAQMTGFAVDLGGVLVVPADMSVEDYIARKTAAGEIDTSPPMPMRDVTPAPRSLMPEPIEHLPEAPIPGSEPAPRRTPSGTRLERGD